MPPENNVASASKDRRAAQIVRFFLSSVWKLPVHFGTWPGSFARGSGVQLRSNVYPARGRADREDKRDSEDLIIAGVITLKLAHWGPRRGKGRFPAWLAQAATVAFRPSFAVRRTGGTAVRRTSAAVAKQRFY